MESLNSLEISELNRGFFALLSLASSINLKNQTKKQKLVSLVVGFALKKYALVLIKHWSGN